MSGTTTGNPNALSRAGGGGVVGGYCHISAIYVSAAVKGKVFK